MKQCFGIARRYERHLGVRILTALVSARTPARTKLTSRCHWHQLQRRRTQHTSEQRNHGIELDAYNVQTLSALSQPYASHQLQRAILHAAELRPLVALTVCQGHTRALPVPFWGRLDRHLQHGRVVRVLDSTLLNGDRPKPMAAVPRVPRPMPDGYG